MVWTIADLEIVFRNCTQLKTAILLYNVRSKIIVQYHVLSLACFQVRDQSSGVCTCPLRTYFAVWCCNDAYRNDFTERTTNPSGKHEPAEHDKTSKS